MITQTQTSLSLVHLIRQPREKPASPPPLLLLLHGVGSHERDLFELAPRLDERFFIVSARGPIALMPGGYAWFQVKFMPDGRRVSILDDAGKTRALLLQFIDELVAAYQLDAQRVYLMGFSQGAIMSTSLALTEPKKWAGVVAMSGRTLAEVLPLQATPEALKGLPILVVHGLHDQKLDISYGRNSRDILSKLPVALSYREYPMGHEVTAESLRDVNAWLKERLDEK